MKAMLAFVLLACWLSLGQSSPASQQKLQEGRAPLAAIQITGSQQWTSEQVAPLTGLRIGQQVGREDFQNAADRLLALGLFSEVHYRFATVQKGVELQFQLADAPEFTVEFDNFPWLTDDEIVHAIEQDGILFKGKVPQSGTILDAIGDSIGKLLATHGIRGQIEHSFIPFPGGSQSVQQFQLSGEGLKIQSVEISDALAKESHQVQDRIPDLVNQPYSQATIALFEFEQLRPVYFQHGYLAVKFPSPVVKLADPGNPAFSPVIISLPVEPGAAFKWEGVAWSGNSAISNADLSSLVTKAGLKSGELADGMKIESLWQMAGEKYGSLGYLDAKITPTANLDAQKGEVSYQVSLTEGKPYRMGNLVLSGLSVDGEHRIRGGWRLMPGQVFDESYFDDFIAQGAKEAFGNLPFHYEKIGHYLEKNPQNMTVNVLLDFQ